MWGYFHQTFCLFIHLVQPAINIFLFLFQKVHDLLQVCNRSKRILTSGTGIHSKAAVSHKTEKHHAICYVHSGSCHRVRAEVTASLHTFAHTRAPSRLLWNNSCRFNVALHYVVATVISLPQKMCKTSWHTPSDSSFHYWYLPCIHYLPSILSWSHIYNGQERDETEHGRLFLPKYK